MTARGGTRLGEPTPLGTPARFEGGLFEIATGAYAWIQPNGGLGESNAGLIVGAGESLLIDTCWDARLTRSMLAAAEAVAAESGAPIRRLLNTHGDGDHWYGNGLIDLDAEILATEAAAAQMAAEPPAMLRKLGPLGPLAGLGSRVPLLPMRARMRGLADFAGQLRNYEFGESLEPRLPGRTFSGSLGIEVGGRRVELFEVGPTHSPGDAIAWLADARVLYAGDIVFSGVTPIMWIGPVEHWIEALARIEALGPEVVVGGHGPAGGIAEVRVLREYWEWLRDRVAAAAGEPAMDLAEGLIRSPEYAAAPWSEWTLPERTVVAVARIQHGLEHGPSQLGTRERISLIAAMGELRERLAQRR